MVWLVTFPLFWDAAEAIPNSHYDRPGPDFSVAESNYRRRLRLGSHVILLL